MSSRGSARLIRHEPALDGLRGLAVVAVLLFHGDHLRGGYLGVDAFFVLSGFLITSLLLAESAAGNGISLRRFWARRARRLLPALGPVLLAVAAYAWLVASPAELATIRGDAIATMSYVANWRQVWVANDYFALFRDPSPLQHTWSLAIEEQFYLVWPLIVVALVRGRDRLAASRRVGAVALGGAAVSVVAAQLLYDAGDPSRVYYGTDTRIASILIGAALAAGIARAGNDWGRRRGLLEAAAIGSIVVLGVAWSTLEGASRELYRGGLVVCAVATAIIIAAGVHPERRWVARALSWRPLGAVGLVSYGLYLWHWPVYIVLDAERVGLDGWPLLAVRVAASALIAVASYRWLEQPIRHGAGGTRWWQRTTPVVAGLVAVAIVAATQGAVSQGADATSIDGRPGGVLVVGDSVAGSLAPGFVDLGMRTDNSWFVGCRVLPGRVAVGAIDNDECPWAETWPGTLRVRDPDVVVLSIGAFDTLDVDLPGPGPLLVPGAPEWNDLLDARLEEMLEILTARGARVVAVDLPCFGKSNRSVADVPRPSGDPERLEAFNVVLERVVARHPARVSIAPISTLLCPDGKARESIGDVARVRDDGVHFSPDGAALVARWMLPYLESAAADDAELWVDGRRPDRLALVYGDAFALEASATVTDVVAAGAGARAVVRAQPLAALCDLAGWVSDDLASLHPDLVVVVIHGSRTAPCMADALADEAEYLDRQRRDVERILGITAAAQVPVVLVPPPPEPYSDPVAQQRALEAVAREAAAPFTHASFDPEPGLALGDARWSETAPCLPEEGAGEGCTGGRIVVRGPGRVEFCPAGYSGIADMIAGCSTYSGGAVRYGRAIAEVILAAV